MCNMLDRGEVEVSDRWKEGSYLIDVIVVVIELTKGWGEI